LDYRARHRTAYISDGVCRRKDDVWEMGAGVDLDFRLHRHQLACVCDCAKAKNIGAAPGTQSGRRHTFEIMNSNADHRIHFDVPGFEFQHPF
jgi:hypothetical protein